MGITLATHRTQHCSKNSALPSNISLHEGFAHIPEAEDLEEAEIGSDCKTYFLIPPVVRAWRALRYIMEGCCRHSKQCTAAMAVSPPYPAQSAHQKKSPPQDLSVAIYPIMNPSLALVINRRVLHDDTPNRSELDRNIIILQLGVRASVFVIKVEKCILLCKLDKIMRFMGGL